MIETTTGMSPPPMASTRCAPSTSAMSVITARKAQPAPEPAGAIMNPTMRTREPMSAPRLSRLRPGSVSGRPGTRPASLAAARTEPVKVTPPTNTPRKTSPRWKAPSEADRASGET